MYKCKCGNTKYFKETYMVETIITIEDQENANSYDKQNDLIMITCLECKDNSEDGSIMDLNENIINLN
jgi:hypothetical protein